MIKKNGFISVSVIYSFFLVILLLLVLIMSTYINNRMSFNVYLKDIKSTIAEDFQCYGNIDGELPDRCLCELEDELFGTYIDELQGNKGRQFYVFGDDPIICKSDDNIVSAYKGSDRLCVGDKCGKYYGMTASEINNQINCDFIPFWC